MPSTKIITIDETAKFIKTQSQICLQRKKVYADRPQVSREAKIDYIAGEQYSLARASCDYRVLNYETVILKDISQFSRTLAWQFADDKDTDEKFLAKYLMDLVEERGNTILSESDFLPMILAYVDKISRHFPCDEDLLFTEIAKRLYSYAGSWAEYHGGWFEAFEATQHSNMPIEEGMRLARTKPFLNHHLTHLHFELKSQTRTDRMVVKDARKKLCDKNFAARINGFLRQYEKEEKPSDDIIRGFLSIADPFAGLLSCLAPKSEKLDESPLEMFIQNIVSKSGDIYNTFIEVLAFLFYMERGFTQSHSRERFHKTVILLFDKYAYGAVEKAGGWDCVLQIGAQNPAEYVLYRAGLYTIKNSLYEVCDTTRDAFCQFVEYLTTSEQKETPEKSTSLTR